MCVTCISYTPMLLYNTSFVVIQVYFNKILYYKKILKFKKYQTNLNVCERIGLGLVLPKKKDQSNHIFLNLIVLDHEFGQTRPNFELVNSYIYYY